MSNVTITVGSKLTLPYPSPMTLESDHSDILRVDLTRDGAAIAALAPGIVWLTAGLSNYLQVHLLVQVVESDQARSASAAGPSAKK